MRECRFRAMVRLDPPSSADSLRRLLDATRGQCVLQPCPGRSFPAGISVGGSTSYKSPVETIVRVRLLAGESEAFFATGQPFTLWADALVDDRAVCGEGSLGDGVILSLESAADRDNQAAARPALTDRRTVPGPRLGAGAPLTAARQ